MKTYELTYIISSRLTGDEMAGLIKDIESFIQEKQGVIITSQKTAAQPLAYPINKQSSGYFATLVFQMEESGVAPLKAKLEKEKEVLRHLLLIKKPVREVKERRMRKPLLSQDAQAGNISTDTAGKKTEKVDEGDLDKKLDEMLS